MVDPEAFGHGLHGFSSALQHQALEVVAAGGALACAGQGGEDLGDELCEVAGGTGGVCGIHNLTLRPHAPPHKS